MARSFRDYSPVVGRRKYDRQYSGVDDEQRNATGIVPGSRHLVLERAVMKLVTGVLFCTLPMEDGS